MSKNLSRREFIGALAVGGVLAASEIGAQKKTETIDRFALVSRHNPVLRKLEPLSPLSVGNGEFAFTCDVTGLQTFPKEHDKQMPLCTMAQWGWHTAPNPKNFNESDLKLVEYDTYGRKVGYMTSSEGQKEAFDWLRQNPHRLHLGQIGLRILKSNGAEIEAKDVSDIEQKLDLWQGQIVSRFRVEGKPVTVKTAAHPTLDLIAVSIESPLISEGKLAVRLAFPYGSPNMNAADWNSADKHQSKIISQTRNLAEIQRTLDADDYFVSVGWTGDSKIETEKAHHFLLNPSKQSSSLEFIAAFTQNAPLKSAPNANAVFNTSAKHWENFWMTGGAVELAGSADKRAVELERRVVLSQYLTAINCSGKLPPQETGLTTNSWYGKYHLEMHWWHAAHFPLWNRLPLLEKSLGWYEAVLPSARNRARQQGYTGARWAKMTAPDGRDSPSPVGTVLIWQQPHPIFYADLCYLSRPTKETLKKYQSIVEETAEFMASYAYFDRQNNRYVLGPPVIPAQENHPARETWNPTFELEYWLYALKTANGWREKLGLVRNPKWDDVINKLSPLPVKDGIYLAHENCPETFTTRNRDHPSMLGALGILKGETVDRETMRRTLKKVLEVWKWEDTWGWDYPMTAMTAARLGEGKIAVDALLLDTPKNVYLPSGHNYQRPNLPLYLPGNGGLLYAIALMAAGWKNAPAKNAPGFPDDGSWKVKAENLNVSVIKQI